MTRKPNLLKCMLGVTVLALLFIASWASTSARLTIAEKNVSTNNPANNVTAKLALPANRAPLAPGQDLISSVFEVDGNIADPMMGIPDDWNTLNCNGGNADVKTFLFDGLGTTIFTQGGSKDPSDISVFNSKGVLIPGWQHTAGSAPDKDEILNAYAAKYSNGNDGMGTFNGDTIIAFGADRFSSSGDAFFGAWFFQKNVYAASDGSFREQLGAAPAATDPLARHVLGDILVLINFTGGGGIATGAVYEWIPAGTPCPSGIPVGNPPSSKTLCDITGTAPFGSVLGVSNDMTGNQDIPDDCQPQNGLMQSWNQLYVPKTGTPGVIPTAHFFEGAINLDAFPRLQNSCFSSILIETRSSSSPSAQLKDFVIGSFNTCAEIGVTKTADDTSICEGTQTTYTYTVSNPTAFNLTITLVDDNETPADTMDDLDVLAGCAALMGGSPSTTIVGNGDTSFMCSRTLGPGTHTNTVKVVASFGSSSDEATASETVNVFEAPTANAGMDQSACESAGFGMHDFMLSGTVTNGTPSWQILAAGNTANCSIFSGGSTLTPTVRCTSFGMATARLTATSDAPAGTDCPAAMDDVVLTIKPNATAAAGADQAVCVDDDFSSTTFNLSGTVTDATPLWEITGLNSANCSIAAGQETSLTPSVMCTAIGTATVQLTAVSNNGCANAVDDLLLTVNANPEANAGDDQVACEAGMTTPFTLAGTASNGTSAWTCVGGDCGQVSITTPSSPTSGVVFTGVGSATLKLTTTSNTTPSCGMAMDTVVLTVDPNPVVTICSDEACSTDENLALTANVSPSGGFEVTYSWSGPGITSDPTLPTITVNLPGNYTVMVTRKASEASQACPGMQTFHVGLCGGAVCSP